MIDARRIKKKNKVAIKGSILDEIRINENGEYYLANSNSPAKAGNKREGGLGGFIQSVLPRKVVDLIKKP